MDAPSHPASSNQPNIMNMMTSPSGIWPKHLFCATHRNGDAGVAPAADLAVEFASATGHTPAPCAAATLSNSSLEEHERRNRLLADHINSLRCELDAVRAEAAFFRAKAEFCARAHGHLQSPVLSPPMLSPSSLGLDASCCSPIPAMDLDTSFRSIALPPDTVKTIASQPLSPRASMEAKRQRATQDLVSFCASYDFLSCRRYLNLESWLVDHDYKFSQFDSAVTILYSNVARCLELVNPETGLLVGLLAFSASPFSASSRTRIVPSTSTSTSTSTSAAPVPTSPKKRDEPRSVLSSMLQDALASSSLNQQHSELDKPSVPFATVAGDNISLLLTNSTLCVFSATALPHSHASPTLDLAQLEPHKSFSIASIAAMVLPHLNIDADQSVDGPHRIDTDDLCIVLRDGTWFWLRLLPNERDILVGLINRSRALSIEDSVPLYELVYQDAVSALLHKQLHVAWFHAP